MRRHRLLVLIGIAMFVAAVLAPMPSGGAPVRPLYSDGTWNVPAGSKLTLSSGYLDAANALTGSYVFHGSHVIVEKPYGWYRVDQSGSIDVTGPAKVTVSFKDVTCRATFSSTSKGVDHVTIAGTGTGPWDVGFADAGGSCEFARTAQDPPSATSANFSVHVVVASV